MKIIFFFVYCAHYFWGRDMQYLIKLGSEITIKSEWVRKQCIRRLKRNILKHLDYYEIDGKITGNWDRIILEVSDLEDSVQIQDILKNISGIENFSPIISFVIDASKSFEESIQNISKEVVFYFWEKIQGKIFAVRVKRSGAHNFSSTEVERAIWTEILLREELQSKVRLENPDVTIQIDIKGSVWSLMLSKISWISWYPVGFQGRLLSLVSWGFDSGLATQMMINRGCEVDYLFFNLGGKAHELWVKQISYYLWKTFSLPHSKARFVSVDFEEVVQEILVKVEAKYRGIVLKRMMLKVASILADKYYYCWIVKGDSVWQVSSQTLQNLHVIDTASQVLTLRPLIWMNKQDIIGKCKKIGTFNFASSMPEYCGVISQKPSVGASKDEVILAEKDIDSSLAEKVAEKAIAERLSQMDFSWEQEYLGEVHERNDEIIIDIREPERVSRSPLSQKWYHESLQIPFYEINHCFPKLDQKKQYLLYCDKGVLSHLHGLYLREKWFSNIQVFRP